MPTDLPDFDECDDSGAPKHVLELEPLPTILPLSDWLGDLARALGAEIDPVPRSTAAVAALLT